MNSTKLIIPRDYQLIYEYDFNGKREWFVCLYENSNGAWILDVKDGHYTRYAKRNNLPLNPSTKDEILDFFCWQWFDTAAGGWVNTELRNILEGPRFSAKLLDYLKKYGYCFLRQKDENFYSIYVYGHAWYKVEKGEIDFYNLHEWDEDRDLPYLRDLLEMYVENPDPRISEKMADCFGEIITHEDTIPDKGKLSSSAITDVAVHCGQYMNLSEELWQSSDWQYYYIKRESCIIPYGKDPNTGRIPPLRQTLVEKVDIFWVLNWIENVKAFYDNYHQDEIDSLAKSIQGKLKSVNTERLLNKYCEKRRLDSKRHEKRLRENGEIREKILVKLDN